MTNYSAGYVDLTPPTACEVQAALGALRLGETGIAMDRVVVNIQHYGNTCSATIPIALAEAMETPAFSAARRVLLVSFGAGATAGAALLENSGEAHSIR